MPSPVILLGGRSLVGTYLLRRLDNAGISGVVSSRVSLPFLPKNFSKSAMDVNHPRDWALAPEATIVSLLPLMVFAKVLPHLKGVKRIIALSSTSCFSKKESLAPSERALAQDLINGENAVKDWCAKNKATFTLLRPTLIYDGKHDKNIARLKNFIVRFSFLPIAGEASGLRQPVHADDVAHALFAALYTEKAINQSFNIAGGNILTYRQMAEKIFLSCNKSPFFISLPPTLLRAMIFLLTQVHAPKKLVEGLSMLLRMNDNLVFDTTDGLRALAYDPRPFFP